MRLSRLLFFLAVISRIGSLFSQTANKLHNARFAVIHELSDMMTDSPPTDSLLGTRAGERMLHVKQTEHRRELGNLLVSAPTRGGKGLLAVSQLLTWNHSVIVNDIKGELYDQTAGYRRTLGQV
jgi:type IV secretion system protein VirD4